MGGLEYSAMIDGGRLQENLSGALGVVAWNDGNFDSVKGCSMRCVILLMLLVGSVGAQDPILWYDFADSASPTANLGTLGSDFDGELQGDTEFVPFDGATGVDMFGSEDHVVPVTGAFSDVFNIADEDFTIEATFQTTLSEPGVLAIRLIVIKQETGNLPAYGLGVRRGSGLASFYICDGATCLGASSASPVNDGLPHTVIAIRNEGFLRMYVDGELVDVTCIPDTFGSTANPNQFVIGGRTDDFAFGSYSSGPFDDFDGTLGEVKIYDYATITVTPATEFLRGDCNIDGCFNIADAVFGLTVLFTGEGPARCDDACDANDDGSIDIADMIFMLDRLFVAGPPPPLPFPDCGVDATDADELCCEFYPSCP